MKLSHQARRTVRVTRPGDLLGFKAFKEGRFEPASRGEMGTLMTTMLSGVATRLWDRCQEIDPAVERRVIKPNGFFSGTFIIAYEGEGFAIEITRRLRTALYLLIPGLTERPSSYEVRLLIRAAESELCARLAAIVDELAGAQGQ